MDQLQGSDSQQTEVLFSPLGVGGLKLRNRLAVAPMTRVSATSTGLPTKHMSDYYTAFAGGGFGLVVTEGLYTDKAYSQGYLFQPGLSDEAQGSGWRPIVERVHDRATHARRRPVAGKSLPNINPRSVGRSPQGAADGLLSRNR